MTTSPPSAVALFLFRNAIDYFPLFVLQAFLLAQMKSGQWSRTLDTPVLPDTHMHTLADDISRSVSLFRPPHPKSRSIGQLLNAG